MQEEKQRELERKDKAEIDELKRKICELEYGMLLKEIANILSVETAGNQDTESHQDTKYGQDGQDVQDVVDVIMKEWPAGTWG
jgi:hypothetical protein